MIYLSPQGNASPDLSDKWGMIITPRVWHLTGLEHGRKWAGDNDAFNGKFKEETFYPWLEALVPYQDTCLFVVAPDVMGDPLATLALFEVHQLRIVTLGFPIAFVAQDGQELLPFPEFDVLFIGGSTDWKLGKGADACIRYAKERGKWVHVGRVNSRKRIRHFVLMDVDSVDGTTIIFAPDKRYRHLEPALRQPPLFYL